MRYLDRERRTITRDDWTALSRSPAYCRVARTVVDAGGAGRLAIGVTWVGMCLDCEPWRGEMLFHAEVAKMADPGPDGGSPGRPGVTLAERWFATEADARGWWEGQVAGAKLGMEVCELN